MQCESQWLPRSSYTAIALEDPSCLESQRCSIQEPVLGKIIVVFSPAVAYLASTGIKASQNGGSFLVAVKSIALFLVAKVVCVIHN